MEAICAYCGKVFDKPTGAYNYAIKIGINIYCSSRHSALGRRSGETKEEKKQIKSWYDMFLRESMTEQDLELDYLQRAVYFQMDYAANPGKYKEIRDKKMPSHVEYCRQPEYREYKKTYDEQYLAKKHYGEYWEAAIVLKKLDKEIDFRESKRQNKIYNKSTTKRKRAWQKTIKQNLKNLTQLI